MRTLRDDVWLTAALKTGMAGTCKRCSSDEFSLRVSNPESRSSENHVSTCRNLLARQANRLSQTAAAAEYLSIEGSFCKNLLPRVVFTLRLNVSLQQLQLWTSFYLAPHL